MATNEEKLDYLAEKGFKVHLWDAGTREERYAQNQFLGRLADAVATKVVGPTAAKILDWEVSLGGDQKTSLRTIIRWQAADFADVKARLDALSAQVGQSGSGETLTKDEQKALYLKAVKESLGTYEVRRVEAPAEGK